MRPQRLRNSRQALALFATSLLVAVTLIYAIACVFESVNPALGFVRAFAEAAMVGALADWFAVTALFRRPLGLPIPHTEIIPRSKERIATGIGRFVESNFLAPDAIADRLGAADVAGTVARWAAEPANAAMLAQRAVRLLPAALEGVAAENVKRLLRETLVTRFAAAEIGPLAAELLSSLVASGRHHAVLDRAVEKLGGLLAEQETVIRVRVAEETSWMWRKLGMDGKVAEAAISVLREMVRQLQQDRQHPLRRRIDEAILEFAQHLREGGEYRQETAQLLQALIDHPQLASGIDAAWSEWRAQLIADAAQPGSSLKTGLAEFITHLADVVLEDEALRKRVNRTFRAGLIELIEAQRAEAGTLVAETVKRWDTQTLVAKVEDEIGRDLQYIRVNGTLIGGLIGVVLHALSLAIR
jgi:uncharacterized membrane-anchored protein YjiN (DUF445 family)